jgi:hypothetical protein
MKPGSPPNCNFLQPHDKIPKLLDTHFENDYS